MIKRIYHLLIDPKIPTISGGLCFFILLNGGSFLFLLVNFSNYFINLIPLIKNVKEGILKDILIYLINHNSNLPISIFLIISSVYSSSSVSYHFINSCELLIKRSNIHKISKRLISIILVPIVLLIIYLVIFILYIIYFFFNKALFYISLILFLFLLIFLINSIALRTYKFNKIFKGTSISVIYIIILTFGFLSFISIFTSFKIVYGILSIFIFVLLYLYLVIVGIFLGIYINWNKLDVFKYLFKKQ